MKPHPFDYVRADTVEEVIEVLAEHGDAARVLAGGQSLLAMLNLRLLEPEVLIDINRIAELSEIREVGGKIEVGAAVTQNRLMAWPGLKEKLPLLAAALPFVGHFQTRNKGTVCGSVAHNDPSSEIPLSLAMLQGRSRAALAPRHARRSGQRISSRHADDRAQAGRIGHRRALPGADGAPRCVSRSGAPAWRFRHHRRRRDRRRKPYQARGRGHGRPAVPFENSRPGSILPTPSTRSPGSLKATKTCMPRAACGAICCAASARR